MHLVELPLTRSLTWKCQEEHRIVVFAGMQALKVIYFILTCAFPSNCDEQFLVMA